MLKMIKPLAASAHIACTEGEVFCFSLHNKVINLVNKSNDLMTLHSYPNGISPMGYLLKKDDFCDIYESIKLNQNTIYQNRIGDVVFGNMMLSHQCRQLDLHVRQTVSVNEDLVYALLSPIQHSTGLFGKLGDILRHPLATDLQSLYEEMFLLVNNKSFNLNPFIGLGPGLTPTFDDILVGIFAVLYTDNNICDFSSTACSSLSLKELEILTTKVSSTFLRYAFKGIFSLNLLAVISAIRQHKTNPLAVRKLLNYGHTSGADLLLGIWIGTLLITKYHNDKGQYARY